jgi:hypothetical protein
MARTDAELRKLLLGALRGGTSVVLATVSTDGVAATALNSWIIAKDENVVALAVDKRSTAYQNISAGRIGVAFELLADDLILAVRGPAQIMRDLESPPFPCALAHIQVESIRDHTVSGVRFQGPRYSYADDKEHRGAIERAILDELGKDVRR